MLRTYKYRETVWFDGAEMKEEPNEQYIFTHTQTYTERERARESHTIQYFKYQQ